ncbi:glycosyltransferase family 4 protein [Candidatus Aenigmatarchaeota archaeon]
MKVCHILNQNLRTVGGVETAVRNIMRKDDDVKFLGASGIKLFIKSFSLSIKLAFSNYDMIHIHDTGGFGYMFLPRSIRKKVLYSSHGFCRTYFDAVKPNGLLKKLQARIYTHMQEKIIKNADVVVSSSEWIHDEIKKIFGIETYVIYNGIDTKKFKPQKIKKMYDYIWVATNPELRGLDESIKLVNKNKKTLAVVGFSGKSTKNIKFLGKIPHDKMPDIYNKAKTILYFGKIKGYPFVLLEAWACGLDAIVNKQAIIEIYPKNKLKEINRISNREGKKIVDKFKWENLLKKYKKVYDMMEKM